MAANPLIYDIEIYQGDDFVFNWALKADGVSYTNLTGYTGKAQIKDQPGGTVYADFTVTFPNAALGQVRLTLTSVQTTAIPPGQYKYDCQLNSGGVITTWLAGAVTVTGEITT